MIKLKKVSGSDLNDLENVVLFSSLFHLDFFKINMSKKQLGFMLKFLQPEYIKNEIKLNQKHYYLIIDTEQNQSIGFIKFQIKFKTLRFWRFYVVKNQRNPQIKNIVLDFLKKFAKENNIEEVAVFIPNERVDLINKIVSWGFKDIKEICMFFGEEIYIYGRKLIVNGF